MQGSIGALDFLIFAAYYLLLAFALRLASIRWKDRPVGKAIAALHG